MFLSANDDRDGPPTARDGMSICMSFALEEELLVEWDDPTCLGLLKNLLIVLQKINKQHNSWNALRK
jgi:hypothetical protein